MASKRILIVEDEKEVSELVATHLQREGFDVAVAANGEEAARLREEKTFHLYILDIMLPDIEGTELLRVIRRTENTPVIMLTAKDAEIDKVVGLTLGADDYVAKPFSLIELTARVKAVLRRMDEIAVLRSEILDPVHAVPAQLMCGPLKLDTQAVEVIVGGERIALKAKEYALLKYFMERPNRILTIAQIYEAVWEREYLQDDNTVMVHISRLRAKIEKDPAAPELLQTIRGLGYRLVIPS